jgi:hypothetical protein
MVLRCNGLPFAVPLGTLDKTRSVGANALRGFPGTHRRDLSWNFARPLG